MKSISESEKSAKKKLKALKIMADVFVFIILEFIEATYIEWMKKHMFYSIALEKVGER